MISEAWSLINLYYVVIYFIAFFQTCRGLCRILHLYASLATLLTSDSLISRQSGAMQPLMDICRPAYLSPAAQLSARDSSKLVEISTESANEYVCSAHYFAWDHTSTIPQWLHEESLLKPYETLMTMVSMNIGGKKVLKDSMFENLSGLEILTITNGDKLESIPASLDSCKNLHNLAIIDTILTSVPSQLNFSQLSSLSLVSCKFTTVPAAICNMVNLKMLDLSYNGIMRLTPCFTKLINLTVLALNGNYPQTKSRW